ncbi:MAG: hypothetical protein L0323_07685 [Planctomycetes bacterium]|nr:hypothetical protein [Planctomycetota bacterium]
MLRITESTKNGQAWLELEGRLVGPWVEVCRGVCARASALGPGPALDVREVRFADAAGVRFLREMDAAGRIAATSSFLLELLRSEDRT